MDTIGLPLLLFALIWGASALELKVVGMLNERRDKILDTESKLSLEHRRLMLYSDWLGLFLGLIPFEGFMVMLLFSSPSLVSGGHENVRWLATILFYITGGVFVVAGVVGFIWGLFDFAAMRKHLLDLQFKKLLEKAEAPPGEKDQMGRTGITDRG